jgi:hypothetical protein
MLIDRRTLKGFGTEIVRINFEQSADFSLTLPSVGAPELPFQAPTHFKMWTVEIVVRVFSAVLEASADPALIVTSCDSRVILQSLIRRLIQDISRSTSDLRSSAHPPPVSRASTSVDSFSRFSPGSA